MYLLTLCFAKLSMIVLLLRFSGTLRAVAWLLRCTAAIITGLTLAFVLCVTFQCTLLKSQ